MNLTRCVEIGRFCGLTTIDECVNNIEFHSMNFFKYSEIEKELNELHRDYDAYIAGEYKLDLEKIDRKNQEDMDRMNEEENAYREANPEDEELVFDFKD